MKPAFPGWGNEVTTAGNASGIGDGAALCILTTRERAEREGMHILGKWVASSVVGKISLRQGVICIIDQSAGVEPRHMGIGPIPAIQNILARTGLAKEDVDVWEVRDSVLTSSYASKTYIDQ